MSQTRRLAAILAADMVGYSRLIEADEARTLQAFKSIRAELFEPVIATHNGRLVKTTGDGFLVELPHLRVAGREEAVRGHPTRLSLQRPQKHRPSFCKSPRKKVAYTDPHQGRRRGVARVEAYSGLKMLDGKIGLPRP